MTVWQKNRAVSSRRLRSDKTVRKPRVASISKPVSFGSLEAGLASTRSPATNAADHTNDAALSANTVGVLATASSRAAIAGPAKNPTLSIVLDAAFAAGQLGRVPRQRRQERQPAAGRKAVPTTALVIDRT